MDTHRLITYNTFTWPIPFLTYLAWIHFPPFEHSTVGAFSHQLQNMIRIHVHVRIQENDVKWKKIMDNFFKIYIDRFSFLVFFLNINTCGKALQVMVKRHHLLVESRHWKRRLKSGHAWNTLKQYDDQRIWGSLTLDLPRIKAKVLWL